jgi:hypothetical protein
LRSNAQDAKLAGLLRSREQDDNSNFVEWYNPRSFAPGHVKFKRLHNKAFVALTRYCQQRQYGNGDDDGRDDGIGYLNMFYLDSPNASTLLLLIDNHGFNPCLCHVFNQHALTCDALCRMLPVRESCARVRG